MALTVGELVGFMRLDKSQWDRKFREGERDLTGMSGKAKSLLAGAGVAAGAAVAVAGKKVFDFGKESFDTFVQFDTKMREVFTLLPDLSARAQGQMTEDVKAFSREMGVTTDKVIPSLYQAISAGVPQQNVFTFLKSAQQLAKAGVTDLEVSVDGLTSVTNAYGPKALSAAKASDILFTAVKEGKTTVDLMAGSVGKVTPLAAALGVQFEDVAAALATITLTGVETSEATTYLRGALAELGKEGTVASEAFEDIAGKTFPDFIREGGNLQEALALMREEADRNGQSVGDMFGSVEAGMAVLSLTGDQADVFAGKIEAMEESAGSTKKAHETMSKGAQQSLQDLSAWWDVLKVNVGDKVAPVVDEVTKKLKRNSGDIEDAVVDAFSAIADFTIDDLLPALEDIGEWFDDNGAGISDFFSGMAVAFHGNTESVSKDAGDFTRAIGGITDALNTLDRWTENAGTGFRDWFRLTNLHISRWSADMAISVLGSYTKAFSWIPGLKGQFDESLRNLQDFRRDVNADIERIRSEKKFRLTADAQQAYVEMGKLEAELNRFGGHKWEVELDVRLGNMEAAGDGLGKIAEGGLGGGFGGSAVAQAKLAAAGLPVTMTNSYRTPAHNARVGGSSTSYHMDRSNPASDWVGPGWALDAMERRLIAMGPHRELLWREDGHYDHLHYAEKGLLAKQPMLAMVGETQRARRGGGEVISPLGDIADVVRGVVRQETGGGPLIGQVMVGEWDVFAEAKLERTLTKVLDARAMRPAAGRV